MIYFQNKFNEKGVSLQFDDNSAKGNLIFYLNFILYVKLHNNCLRFNPIDNWNHISEFNYVFENVKFGNDQSKLAVYAFV